MGHLRLNAAELQQIQEHAISLMQSNPEMKKLIFRLLGEVTLKREEVIYQFINDITKERAVK